MGPFTCMPAARELRLEGATLQVAAKKLEGIDLKPIAEIGKGLLK